LRDAASDGLEHPRFALSLITLYTSIVISTAHLRFCTERGRLLDLLTTAVSDYAKVADELAGQMSILSPLAYRRKRLEVEGARIDAQNARDALFTHRKEHGC